MISQEKLLKKYNISNQQFKIADISWETLEFIYKDYSEKRKTHYKKIMEEFQYLYIQDTKQAGIHSYRSRLKDPEHLVAKIIRKRFESHKKYKSLNKDNYENFITDIIGFRTFILFKEEWIRFHTFINKTFTDDESCYVKDWSQKYVNSMHFLEAPKVHIRTGDDRNIYVSHIKDANIHSNKTYRSVLFTRKVGEK